MEYKTVDKRRQIISSIYERKPCFLTSPDWRDIAFDTTGLGFDDCLYTEVLHRMADFSSLLKELKELDEVAQQQHQQPINHAASYFDTDSSSIDFSTDSYNQELLYSTNLYQTDPTTSSASPSLSSSSHHHHHHHPYEHAKNDLLNRLHHLKDILNNVGRHLTANLADGSAAIELPAREEGSPIPTVFHFSSWRVAVAYNCYWSLLILTNRLICKLLPAYDSLRYTLETECRNVAYNICQTWEDAWDTRPIGALHVPLGFVLAHEFCVPDVQEWIIKGLNALLDQQHVDNFRWSDDVIRMMSGKLGGEGPGLSFRM